MEKQIILRVDGETHSAFKSKAAVDSLQMSDILRRAIDDYLSGKWKPRKRVKRVKDASN